MMINSHKVLDLRNNHLIGSFPYNISGACDLRWLELSENQLQGKLPLSVENCRMLEVLDNRKNQIEDVFPCQFKFVPSLGILVLKFNKLHGEIECLQAAEQWHMGNASIFLRIIQQF